MAGCASEPFEQATRERVSAAGVRRPRDLDALALADLTRSHLDSFRRLAGRPFPQDPGRQLEEAVQSVLASWLAPKAREYRRLNDVPEHMGTAVILQRMVFGNAGGLSGSGVAFTRDPTTGERGLYMDFLLDAQGEDIVSGRQAVDTAEELALLAPELHERIDGRLPRARDRVRGCAGVRVHRPGRRAVPASDAKRQAHAVGRPAHRGRPRGRAAHHPPGGA